MTQVTSVSYFSLITLDQKGPEEQSPLVQMASSFDVLSFISLQMWAGGPLGRMPEIMGASEVVIQGHGENRGEPSSAVSVQTLPPERCVRLFISLCGLFDA